MFQRTELHGNNISQIKIKLINLVLAVTKKLLMNQDLYLQKWPSLLNIGPTALISVPISVF